MTGKCPFASRRGFLAAAGGLMAAAAPGPSARAASDVAKGISPAGNGPGKVVAEPFHGAHQGGILTGSQNHTYFAAFDLVAEDRAAVVAMLKAWTEASARMTAGRTAQELDQDTAKPGRDSGDALGLAPARLTITFGFGPGLFEKDGRDRYGLAVHRPEALEQLPVFTGDQLVAAHTGGDLSVQACADDPQVAFHAVRQLARLAYEVANLRWVQTGFMSNYAAEDTPRNLMGFKDGTQNPTAQPPRVKSGGTVTSDPQNVDDIVWVGQEGPAWLRGGSYAVVRRIRIALEHWDRVDVSFQEQVIGRHKYSGAPLGKTDEFDALDLDAEDSDGNPVIPDTAHVRLAAAERNGGAQILRRSYSYNDGVNMTAERWPPWRQGLEYDAGLLFVCYQQDPRTGFSRIFEPMSKLDMLNQFTTHVGSGLFACPPGAAEGQYIGQALFES